LGLAERGARFGVRRATGAAGGLAGTSLVMTAPAPTNANSPSVTPHTTVALAPIEEPRFTSVARYSFFRDTWLRGLSTLVNTIDGPQKTSSSSVTPS